MGGSGVSAQVAVGVPGRGAGGLASRKPRWEPRSMGARGRVPGGGVCVCVCVWVCVCVEWGFLVNSSPLPETFTLHLKTVNFLLYMSSF